MISPTHFFIFSIQNKFQFHHKFERKTKCQQRRKQQKLNLYQQKQKNHLPSLWYLNKQLDDSVKFINEKANETLYKGSIEIGEHILKHFFNDDIDLASSRNPRKPQSFKALCEREDLVVSHSTLTKMVRVAAQERFFLSSNIKAEKLSYTHKAELIKLDNDDKKIEMVEKCVKDKLTTRQLGQMISDYKKSLPKPDTSNISMTIDRFVSNVDRLITKSEEEDLVTDLRKLKTIRAKTRENLRQKLDDTLAKIDKLTQIKNTLKTLKSKLDTLEERDFEKEEKTEEAS